MSAIVERIWILVAVVIVLWLLARLARVYIERQRQALLASSEALEDERETGPISILAFSSEDCRQCHTMQMPALENLLRMCGDAVEIFDIDAVQEAELAKQYRVMTVPTTVVLDGRGQVRAVNYGFASTKQLMEQVETCGVTPPADLNQAPSPVD